MPISQTPAPTPGDPPFDWNVVDDLIGNPSPAPADPAPEDPAPTTPAPVATTPAPPSNFNPTGTYYSGWKSVADPHITNIHGTTLPDIASPGSYDLLHSDQGPALDVTTQVGSVAGRNGLWNTQATVQVGSDTVSFDAATNTLTVNGVVKPFNSGGTINLPGGGQIQMLSENVGSTACNKIHIFTGVGSTPHNMVNSERISLLCYPNKPYIDVAGKIDKGRTDMTGVLA